MLSLKYDYVTPRLNQVETRGYHQNRCFHHLSSTQESLRALDSLLKPLLVESARSFRVP